MTTGSTGRVSTRDFKRRSRQFFEQGKKENSPCWLCGQPIDYDVEPNSTDESHNLDHFIPVSVNPSMQYDPANWRHSHRICNILRGAEPPKIPLGMFSREWY